MAVEQLVWPHLTWRRPSFYGVAIVISLQLVGCSHISSRTSDAGAQLHDLCREFSRRADTSLESARHFGNVASGTEYVRDEWREFASLEQRVAARTDDNLYEVADVWMFPGEGSLVRMDFSSPSGDWSDHVDYCFRPDGTLSVIDAELRTFYGNMIVNRSSLFDSAGRGAEVQRTYRDLQSKQQTDAKGTEGLGYQDHIVPEYTTMKALLFWSK